MDPDTPGAEYEGMKRFFESGEWNITAETDWYMQRAFQDADGVWRQLLLPISDNYFSPSATTTTLTDL